MISFSLLADTTLNNIHTVPFKLIDDDYWDAQGLESIALCVCQCACDDDESSTVFWFPRATMSERKAVIKNADMSEDMQQDAVECATQALEKYNIEKDIAAYIKKVKTTADASNIFLSSSQSRFPTELL